MVILGLQLVLGYVTVPATENASFMLRWTMPADFGDTSGLGGGLSYVVERDFCAKMIEQFGEKDWLDCDDINNAIRRGFQTWAANHQLITFSNVSNQCFSEAAVIACEQQNALKCNPTTGWERLECFRQRGNCTKLCNAAEIVILAEQGSTDNLIDSIAYVQYWDSLGINTNESVEVKSRGPRLTNGIVSLRDARIRKATITFMRQDCFYLDSLFCPALHRAERDFGSVLVWYALFTMPFFALALVILTARFFVACKVFVKRKNGWGLALRDAIHVLAEPLTEIWLIIFLITMMPFLYFGLAQPCMSCFDFEASFTHEVGLALGLSQPDAPGHTNYVLISPLNASTCGSRATLLPGQEGALAVSGPVADEWTVMKTLRKRQAAPCPTVDDLAGLNMLYPTCEDTRQMDPLCFKSFENLGLLRLMSSVGLSIAISFTVAACLSRGSQIYEKFKIRLINLEASASATKAFAAVSIQARFRGHKARSQAAREFDNSRDIDSGAGALGYSCFNPASESDEAAKLRDQVPQRLMMPDDNGPYAGSAQPSDVMQDDDRQYEASAQSSDMAQDGSRQCAAGHARAIASASVKRPLQVHHV